MLVAKFVATAPKAAGITRHGRRYDVGREVDRDATDSSRG